jgi:hypothetical protein
LRAEATSPSLGKNVKSLAGGHAVALVWRDPYPAGIRKRRTLGHKRGGTAGPTFASGQSAQTRLPVVPSQLERVRRQQRTLRCRHLNDQAQRVSRFPYPVL